ncbi:2-dehydropantoate 2-reductase [Xenorhabdus siamensis]|uniref:2-dehydropantoate 2-reductase n=1 Tax=Xenorhabdus siamensis TaxID=3136254 RepID=UPI0030F407F0
MKITVLGCGAMGKLWLAALSQQHHEIQAWLKAPQPFVNVHIDNFKGKIFDQQLPANNEKHLFESELLLVCLKAWQVSDAINNLASKLSPHCPILLLHNGMGTQDELLSLPNPILSGVTTHGAYQENGIVYHKSQGITHIGSTLSDTDKFSFLAKILHDALPNVKWHDDIYTISWLKLAVNCVINPLTVIYDCKNGELSHHVTKIHSLCDEIYQVMQKEGLQITKPVLIKYVMDVIEQTSENSSSMRQDIRAQRPTEIDYITGFLLYRARVHGLVLTENIHIYHFIKRKEEKYEHFSSHLPRTR